MDADNLMKTVTAKLGVLELSRKQTEAVLKDSNDGDVSEINRKLKLREAKLYELNELIENVQEKKLLDGENTENVESWGNEMAEKLKVHEDIAKTMRTFLKTIGEKDLRNLNAEREGYEMKLLSDKSIKNVQKIEELRVKLPPLNVTKFDGSLTDFMRFWSMFREEIDKTSISATSKFSYLKELLTPKVRSQIEGLPFTLEGYERAKAILQNKFGKSSEIVNAHVNQIMNLPTINNANTTRINEFYETLVRHTQALETMGKLQSVNGYTRNILDRLPGIRSDLARDDEYWKEWKFPDLVESLRKWTERNPVDNLHLTHHSYRDEKNGVFGQRREKMYRTGDKNSHQNTQRIATCVYCKSEGHKSHECTVVLSCNERKRFLAENKRCFNCTGEHHQAFQCQNKRNCYHCSARHHSSICEKQGKQENQVKQEYNNTRIKHETQNSQPMLTTRELSVIYPVVMIIINGVKCRALLDTGAGSSYISAGMIEHLGVREYRKEERQIEMMFSTQKRKVKIFPLEVCDINNKHVLTAEMTEVDRKILLSISNPRYEQILREFEHLDKIKINDSDTKEELPIHVILGASEYAQLKTSTKPLIGNPGEPIAEYTRLGWTIMSSGRQDDVTSMFLTKNSSCDYDRLCRLDVLGIEDAPEGSQKSVYEEFKEQLKQGDDGHYETGLIWKLGHSPLPPNKSGSLRRLSGLLHKLEKDPETLQAYDNIIKDQLVEGIVEKVPESDVTKGKVFYLPHKAVIRAGAESTKIRQVCDASARENGGSPSLNDCLEVGPPLQNLLWNILVRIRFRPIALCGDLQKAFLQVRIREEDRDALRFHWVKDLESKKVEVLRFTRALFGLNQSPFILGATLEIHLKKCLQNYPKDVILEILQSLYVDDVIKGLTTVEEGRRFKEIAIKALGEAGFTLHKWHSNEDSLEGKGEKGDEEEITYAKQNLEDDNRQTKILGLIWNKVDDTLSVKTTEIEAPETKRGVLKFLAAIYDPLGMISPVTLTGKCIFRDICEEKYAWDTPLSGELLKRWQNFIKTLPDIATVKRTFIEKREEILFVDLHAFGDASKLGTATAIYAVVHQPNGVYQGLIAAKARISKKTTIPRLELIAAVMAANLMSNVRQVLATVDGGVKIRREVCWSDSSTVLHWIRGDSNTYKQFVRNQVGKISQKSLSTEWRHVPGLENPADVASRGAKFHQLQEDWWNGPTWLREEGKWPPDIQTVSSPNSQAEVKMIKEVLNLAVDTEVNDDVGTLIEKFSFKKTVRITSWMMRFKNNCSSQEKQEGPLLTDEINKGTLIWIKRTQESYESDPKFNQHVNQLNLKRDYRGVYVCIGRIQGMYPIYLPTRSMFTKKVVMNSHLATLHGGVGLTMTHVRENYWIPQLRQLSKNVRRLCFGCKRMQVTPLHRPPPANLPIERTVGERPFQVIGLDFAGPIMYRKSAKVEGKSYIMVFTCSLTRALCLELLPDQSVEQFIPSLKRLIARRGRPSKIYSDNFSTFKSTAKWLKRVVRSENLHEYLSSNDIKWQFNLSRAPWWGGQFERMVGLVKQTLFKVIGNATLRWDELNDVLIDVELTLNNRPLSYVEDDIDMPILTPNVMMFGQNTSVPDEEAEDINDRDLRKRARYLQICKNKIWNRWSNEYLRGLREQHDLTHKGKPNLVNVGDVMLIKGESRNRTKWKIGIVTKLIVGRDGVVRGAELRAGKDHLERAMQHLYPMELQCDRGNHMKSIEKSTLNVKATRFLPKRNAAVISSIKTREQLEVEEGVPTVE